MDIGVYRVPRSKSRAILTAALISAGLFAAGRMAWVTSQTETGWRTVGQQWFDATLGRLWWRRVFVSIASPCEEAEYWLAETDRIANAPDSTAELAMGGAWVLDVPSLPVHFQRREPWLVFVDKLRLPWEARMDVPELTEVLFERN